MLRVLGTKQACLFRDSYAPLTATGLSIYGLSTDSLKANTNFKTKQNLPYTLLCDPKATLISAIGLKSKSTTRGVFVVDKSGKVLAAEPGSPDGTVAVVRKLVASNGDASGAPPPTAGNVTEDKTAPGDQKVAEQETTTENKAKEDAEKANAAADVSGTAKEEVKAADGAPVAV